MPAARPGLGLSPSSGGGLTGVASCPGEAGEEGGALPPQDNFGPLLFYSASISLTETSVKAKPEVQAPGSISASEKSHTSPSKERGHREGQRIGAKMPPFRLSNRSG